ncbi:MAG: TSUP family transporter [Acidiferrobacterales bacterium]|nr:TSUP family transporter [Acidiferrobacterales bacterium]
MVDFFNVYVGDLGLTIVLMLLISAIIAGYVDTLVGGGGLITIPALLAAGVPPIQALGTNKFQACAGTGTATLTLLAKRQVKFHRVRWAMFSAFIGSLLGAVIVQGFDPGTLEFVIPIIIVAIVVYFVVAPKPIEQESEPKLNDVVYRSTAVPSIGFYDGMFGPATGSFFVLAGVSLQGQGIRSASITAKTLNFATNLAALLVFLWFGQVSFFVGCVMMIGQFVGASIGARALMSIDPNKLRGLVVAICMIMLVAWFAQRL